MPEVAYCAVSTTDPLHNKMTDMDPLLLPCQICNVSLTAREDIREFIQQLVNELGASLPTATASLSATAVNDLGTHFDSDRISVHQHDVVVLNRRSHMPTIVDLPAINNLQAMNDGEIEAFVYEKYPGGTIFWDLTDGFALERSVAASRRRIRVTFVTNYTINKGIKFSFEGSRCFIMTDDPHGRVLVAQEKDILGARSKQDSLKWGHVTFDHVPLERNHREILCHRQCWDLLTAYANVQGWSQVVLAKNICEGARYHETMRREQRNFVRVPREEQPIWRAIAGLELTLLQSAKESDVTLRNDVHKMLLGDKSVLDEASVNERLVDRMGVWRCRKIDE